MKEKIKVSINVSGGNVQQILTNHPDVEVKLYDYDNAEEGGYTKAMEVAEKRYNKDLTINAYGLWNSL
jgi:hypothetical protein|tara:strand:- start:946 stop:1149 length:204 start_codon:yes stop_codon:yes gene_type:complete